MTNDLYKLLDKKEGLEKVSPSLSNENNEREFDDNEFRDEVELSEGDIVTYYGEDPDGVVSNGNTYEVNSIDYEDNTVELIIENNVDYDTYWVMLDEIEY